ncbi:putative alpha/beta hydrolase-1 [Dioscorea sansibarensis]
MATDLKNSTAIVVALTLVLGSWYYAEYIRPPPPTPCGTEGGPPVTASRIRLRDGRFLAYKETGVQKDRAEFKIVFCHGFLSSRLFNIGASPELMEELRVYIVAYDRAGHGESDPNPKRSLRSEASDIEELADALNLGPRFYVIGYSLGGHASWASIKYIPGRLAGAAFLAPVINYWWPGFPKNLSSEAYNKQVLGDQWALRVAHYAPWLLHWWMKQSWLPTSTVIKGTTFLPNQLDARMRDYARTSGIAEERMKLATQQGVQESLYRDMAVMFGKWEFDPMDLLQPSFPVHLWQGDEDGLVPVTLQRYICSHLRWIDYHELSETGHYYFAMPGFGDILLKTLLVQTSSF